jgi:hypothetical protein
VGRPKKVRDLLEEKGRYESVLGNPVNAKEARRIAYEVAKRQGKDAPDNSQEFYDDFCEEIDPYKRGRGH